MQAFPEGSLNNSIVGSGPLRDADHSTFMGNANEEAFQDYAYSSNKGSGSHPLNKGGPAIFDPVSRGEVIHGDESEGLGTSTFLEGTPAARAAIARHYKEQSQELAEVDLRRKKSLAQRIRHVGKSPRDYNTARMHNPDLVLGKQRSPQSAGVGTEVNPFFSEYSQGEESITVRGRDDGFGHASSSLDARRRSGGQLERRMTSDGIVSEEPSKPSGLLGRMKSLKGGKRSRNPEQPRSPPPQPGTAI